MKTITLLILTCSVLTLPVQAQNNANVPTQHNEATIAQLQEEMALGKLTSVQLTNYYIARINALDQPGPDHGVNSSIELNPDAIALAQRADNLRKQGKVLGPLHGIPVLLKDNTDDWKNSGKLYKTPDWTPTTSNPISHTMGKKLKIKIVVQAGPQGSTEPGRLVGWYGDKVLFDSKKTEFKPGKKKELTLETKLEVVKKVRKIALDIEWHVAEPDIADLSKQVELALFSERWKFIACQSTPQLPT